MALDLEPTRLEDSRSLLEKLLEEMKAVQRSIALNQQRISTVDRKIDEFIKEGRTRYKEDKIRRRERCW